MSKIASNLEKFCKELEIDDSRVYQGRQTQPLEESKTTRNTPFSYLERLKIDQDMTAF